ncbi:MAG: hypothetical protein BGO49_26480 [Planctomycetales bacterium 71-10]|nr:MAG: hypothetical protein BGO49_26480 [Planctomycetales bacterium 71-10]
MADELPDRFRRWFEYERDAHARVFKSLATVPEDRRSGPEYRKALDLLAHIVAARRNWLARLGGGDALAGPVFPQGARVEDVAAQWDEAVGRWEVYLGRLDDAELARVADYRMSDGTPCRNVAEDLLVQLYGHSHYHRGQIAMLVRAAGGEPAATDFIHWLRRGE